MTAAIADDHIAFVGIKVRLSSALTTRTIMWTFMVEAAISTLDLEPRLVSASLHAPPLGRYYRLMVFLFSINKFLIKAGNAEQFDGNPSVDKALERLGLRTQYDLLPEMEVALMLHQTIGAAWMLDKELSYFKGGGGLGDDMGLRKVSLGRIFLTPPVLTPRFVDHPDVCACLFRIGLSLMFLTTRIAVIVQNQSTDLICKITLVIAPTALLDQWMEIDLKSNCELKSLIYYGL